MTPHDKMHGVMAGVMCRTFRSSISGALSVKKASSGGDWLGCDRASEGMLVFTSASLQQTRIITESSCYDTAR